MSTRSIPAHTGKPLSASCCATTTAVYPRPHGEASLRSARSVPGHGLSPPTRGSRPVVQGRGVDVGSIPAHTGKPFEKLRKMFPNRVYPRPHGEAGIGVTRFSGDYGLSPPTRGSPPPPIQDSARLRSIPAHTGKPRTAALLAAGARVYPRPHGEAACSFSRALKSKGLSPPTRGSHGVEARRLGVERSIPAHTGKPRNRRVPGTRAKVYPRPHGEALARAAPATGHVGLSPPTRGSRRHDAERGACAGSIPAHTGKPPVPTATSSVPSVYPRPHGEAGTTNPAPYRNTGLSPPTRGSLPPAVGRPKKNGSIPAHTGKPCSLAWTSPSTWVYPRPHGEAHLLPLHPGRQEGLSPPTRGSRGHEESDGDPAGSIPAHTGKPQSGRLGVDGVAVYPRPHGEACILRAGRHRDKGLSPPTRGSRPWSRVQDAPQRSIPAHTGKPCGALRGPR